MPSFQNINTDAGQGDSLKTAFTKVNANFQSIQDGTFVVVSNAPVNSVAGRQGDIVLTINDITGGASVGYVNEVFQTAIESVVTTATLDSAIETKLNDLLDGAPEALNTLNELAQAIGDDADFAGTITGELSALSTAVANNLAYTNTQVLALNTKLTSGNISTSGDITAANITATVSLTGQLTGNVTGNLTGNVTGTVSSIANHSTTTLAEGTNLYYTSARTNADFDTRLATKTTDDLTEGNNLYYTTARDDANFATNLAARTTGNLAEGANLYYTDARAFAAFDTKLATKTTGDLAEGVNLYYTEARVDANIAGKSTDDLSEGANLYYTEARVDANFNSKSTDDLSEGIANLYYTDARARDAISVTGSGSYDADTGVINIQGGVTSVNTATGDVVLTTSEVNEGSNLYYTDARVGTYLTDNAYATESYVDTAVAGLVDTAPAALDTLNELAAALGDDANFATTVSTQLGLKADAADLANYATNTALQTVAATIPADVGQLNNDVGYLTTVAFDDLIGKPTTLAGYGITDSFDGAYSSLSGAPTLATVATSGSYNDLADKPVFDTGNFTFTSNTIAVGDTNGGITINANGSGEIVLSDFTGINNTNPGAWLHVGNTSDLTQTGSIAIGYGDASTIQGAIVDGALTSYTMGGDALLSWDWGDNGANGSVPGSNHARFGIFGGSLSKPWLTFDRETPGDALAFDSTGRFIFVAKKAGTYVENTASGWYGSSNGDQYMMSDDAAGGLSRSTSFVPGRAAETPSYYNTHFGYSFNTQWMLTADTDGHYADRIRSFGTSGELNLNGRTWEGYDSSVTLAGASQNIKILNGGTVGHATASISIAQAIVSNPLGIQVTNAQNRGLISGHHAGVQIDAYHPDAIGEFTNSHIDVAAGYVASIKQFDGLYDTGAGYAVTIGKAVGLYLPWMQGAYNWIRGRAPAETFSLLSESPTAVLRNQGNVEIGGNLILTGTGTGITLPPGSEITATSETSEDWLGINGFLFNNGTPQIGDPEPRGIFDSTGYNRIVELKTVGGWFISAADDIRMEAGTNPGGVGNNFTILAGNGDMDDPFGSGPGRKGGDLNMTAGDGGNGTSFGDGGEVNLKGGIGQQGGNVTIWGGSTGDLVGGIGGSVKVRTGSSSYTNGWEFNSSGQMLFPDSSVQTTAYTGDYNDLTNKPTVPTALTDLGITDGTSGQILTTDGSGNFSFSSTVESVTTTAGATLSSVMQLPLLSSEPVGAEGMIAMADGDGWAPNGTGVVSLMAYVGGAWRTLTSGSGA